MTVGQQLRQARSAHRRSIAEIAGITKIQPWVLEALEEDRLHEMMSPIYVKGFLSTYAKYLHLESERLISQLPLPRTQPQPNTSLPRYRRFPFKLSVPHLSVLQLRALVFSVSLVMLVTGILILNPLRWSTDFSLSKGVRTKLASFGPVTEKNQSLETGKPNVLPGQPLVLSIIAHRTTWVQVRADGKLLTQQRLPRGAHERWTAKRSFDIIIAKPSQIEISLNGQSINPFAISYRGKLHITRSGITELDDKDS